MALDVAEFLWSKFVSSLQEAESELSGSISISVFKSIKNLISVFRSIKDVVKEIDIMPERYSYSETIRLLYDLNDALAECRIFAHECKEINKKLLLFNPFTHYFIQRMKTRLARIKLEFEKMEPPKEEEEEEISSPLEDTVSAQVFGFDKESKEIEDLLVGGGFGFRAIGVVGIAGVGKTTLVHKVLEMQTVKENFSPIIWVPFSGMKQGEQQFSRFSFETCVFGDRIVGLDKLMERLDPLLSGKKYLVVLDDVCRRHINIQDRLWRRLPKGSGGAVIVTSRLMEVAQKLNNLVVVDPLDREVCWRIFEEILKNNEGNLNMSQSKTLESIKNEIKDQCQGLPLAAKTLASIVPEQIRELEYSSQPFAFSGFCFPVLFLHVSFVLIIEFHVHKSSLLVFIRCWLNFVC